MKSKVFIPVTPAGSNRGQLRQSFTDKVKTFLYKEKLVNLFRKEDKIKAVITFHYPQGGNHKDLDNTVKSLLDVMKGITFPDDMQIWDMHLRKICPSDKNGIELRLFKMGKKKYKTLNDYFGLPKED